MAESTIMEEKYNFKRLDWKHDKILICPACLETLFRSDIEHYQKCPYCNQSIELNTEIEDYLLKPAVDKWIIFQSLTLPQYSLDILPPR